MTPQTIALNRFGLGYRQGDKHPVDPKGWLRSQISQYVPRPGDLATYDTSSTAVRERVAQFGENRAARALARKGGGEDANERGKAVIRKQVKAQKTELANEIGMRLAAAQNSDTPFMERMVWFWANHFAVSTKKPSLTRIVAPFEFGAIRPHVTGKFSDLLRAASLHPGMLLYLDQTRSTGPDADGVAGKLGRKFKGLNENLGREILELHTLGVDGGYTQTDVIELSKALTGWVPSGSSNLSNVRDMGAGSGFAAQLHEPGPRTVLGKRYGQHGPEQAIAILDDLAVHPATARHIATKVARHFAGDDPPDAMVARLEQRFTQTGGDLSAMYHALIDSPEAWVATPLKVRQPFEWVVGMLRVGGQQLASDWRLAVLLNRLGQPVWGPDSPAGWDDRNASWLAPEALVRRVEVADTLSLKTRLTDVRQLAEDAFPGSLSESTRAVLRGAESNQMALALLAVSPEMMRR